MILYVDDDQAALDMLKTGLEEKGFKVQTFSTGNDALEYLQTAMPQLIIADLRMQPMNGFEFFQAVKKIRDAGTVPFLFLTAVDDHLAQKYSQTLGVDAYVVKPIDMDNFESIIRRKLAEK